MRDKHKTTLESIESDPERKERLEKSYQEFLKQEQEDETCPLCGRPFGGKVEKHHLVPDSRGGKETTRLHKICHRKIHATFSEKQLEKEFNTVEILLENEEIRKFVAWVQKKEPDYYDSSSDSNERKRRRRR